MHNETKTEIHDFAHKKELDLIYAISSALSQSMNLREILGPVLKAMATHMGMLRGTITIVNRETDTILIEEAYGLTKSQQARGKYRLGEGITGKVVLTGKNAIIPRISDEPLFLDKTQSRLELLKKDISFICVPIKLEDNVIGTLNADRLYNEDISLEEDMRLLNIIANMIAHAVHLRQQSREEIQNLYQENMRLNDELKSRFQPENIIGSSDVMKEVYAMIEKVLKSSTTVLIRGESGVGKELVAHAVHYNSNRANYPFIKVNCSALPENLIESELFGYEKGAFTGALNSRKGKFEAAQDGTIFLDEMGDIPQTTQVKILRVLQEKELVRLGSNHSIKINVRVIAATNRNLEKLVESKEFREDLYYRLNVFPIYVPPLRKRKNDIIPLANFFMDKFARSNGKNQPQMTKPFLEKLLQYEWPGNVRELENTLERAILLSNDEILHAHHLPGLISKNTEEASYDLQKKK